MRANSEHTIKNRKIILLLLGLILIFQVVLWIINPGSRVGFFGIGLPADMTEFQSTIARFRIAYPETWVAANLPQGNHGDKDVVAKIQVPGRSWPSLTISAIPVTSTTAEMLLDLDRQKKDDGTTYSEITLISEEISTKTFLVRHYQWSSHSSLFGDYAIECKTYFYIGNSLGYTLDFCAEESQWSTLEGVFTQMINSFSVE